MQAATRDYHNGREYDIKHHHHDTFEHYHSTINGPADDHDHDAWHHHHGPDAILNHKHDGPTHHIHDYDIRTTWNIDNNNIHYGDYHDDEFGSADHNHD